MTLSIMRWVCCPRCHEPVLAIRMWDALGYVPENAKFPRLYEYRCLGCGWDTRQHLGTPVTS